MRENSQVEEAGQRMSEEEDMNWDNWVAWKGMLHSLSQRLRLVFGSSCSQQPCRSELLQCTPSPALTVVYLGSDCHYHQGKALKLEGDVGLCVPLILSSN